MWAAVFELIKDWKDLKTCHDTCQVFRDLLEDTKNEWLFEAVRALWFSLRTLIFSNFFISFYRNPSNEVLSLLFAGLPAYHQLSRKGRGLEVSPGVQVLEAPGGQFLRWEL